MMMTIMIDEYLDDRGMEEDEEVMHEEFSVNESLYKASKTNKKGTRPINDDL